MKCSYESCNNEARYINERSDLCCGTCPIKFGHDSIRLGDVSKLLLATRELIDNLNEVLTRPSSQLILSDLRSIIGRRP